MREFNQAHINENVMIYRNLHKNCWSAKSSKTGIVLFHSLEVLLKKAKFKVSEAGRQRVLKEKAKNVHAGVIGIVCGVEADESIFKERVRYNPYETETFVMDCNNNAIYEAELVYFSKQGRVFIERNLIENTFSL